MSDSNHTALPEDTRKALGVDGMVIGLLLGGIMIFWAGNAYLNHVHLIESAVQETFWVAAYLTMLVAYCGFKMLVFAHKSPFWSTFWLIQFAGHISLLFDSFAVVLLIAGGITFLPLDKSSDRFNQFFVKVAASFAALTVGGGFYLGELWGLPWFITNNLDNPLAGLPMLLVLTPYCTLVAFLTAWRHPVKMEKVEIDGRQLQATVEFVAGLLLIIVTHSPFLCIGVLFFYSALRRRTVELVEKTAHELTDGAQNALGLILLAVVIQLAGLTDVVQPLLHGWGMLVGAAISSPFAGAMAPAATNLHEFYVGLSMLMVGAPLFVFSSLVAIVVFKDHLKYEDFPDYIKSVVRLLGAERRGHMPEGIAYTVIVLPMVAGLALLLWLANSLNVFVFAAHALGIQIQ